MSAPYIPINCGLYDHLEIHALRGTPLDVDHVTPDGAPERLTSVRLVTIRQASDEEIGVFRGDAGRVVEVRLDRLRVLIDRGTGRRLELVAP